MSLVMPVIYFLKIYKILIFQTTFNNDDNNDHKKIITNHKNTPNLVVK